MSEIIQGSDEWKQLRLGKVTASRVADVMALTKSGAVSRDRANYAAQLIAERLTGVVAESYVNAAMQHGTDTEPEARNAYCFYSGWDVQEVAFVRHPTIFEAGCSPDGLVGDDGLVEIKCPNTATHLDTLLGQATPAKYIDQIQFQLACTGRAWCDLVSYDNRLPERMRLFVRRVARDDKRIAELEAEAEAFLQDIEDRIIQLEKLYGEREAA
jgi:putative phage-type endonuclease